MASKNGATTTLNYKINIDGEVGALKEKLETIKSALDSVGEAPKIRKTFKSLDNLFSKIQQKISSPPKSSSVFDSVNADLLQIKQIWTELAEELTKHPEKYGNAFKDLIPKDLTERFTKINQAMENYSAAAKQATLETEDLITARSELAKRNAEKVKAEGAHREKELSLNRVQSDILLADERIKALQDLRDAAEDATERVKELDAVYEANGWNKSKKYSKDGIEYNRPGAMVVKRRTEKQFEDAGGGSAIEDLEKSKIELNKKEKTRIAQLENATNKLQVATEAAENANAEYEKLLGDQKASEAKALAAAFNDFRNAIAKIEGLDLSEIDALIGETITPETTERIEEFVNNFNADYFEKVRAQMGGVIKEIEDVGDETGGVTKKVLEQKEAWEQTNEAQKQYANFIEKAKQFLGLAGAVEVFRRAISNAIQTVKELDAVMTEMAVVTEGTISDYWSQLPEYTQRANELGVSIAGAYEAATIYYQQGLDTNEVIGLSVETLKMARVAGLNAAEATDRMTSALRGFNMELNETSAQKVADVYSELAAISAADVDEISTAMSKVASLANSAGMSFEFASALLTQGIETTRESAQTIGTSLKTVLARFTEVKNNPNATSEVEGESVDANAIEGAMRSIGISMRDDAGQFRDMGDVLLELSSKWDTLDVNTQRWIATLAAGSRQQSRFLSMISDYDRLLELVDSAQNSTGANAEQFEKTMDSYQTRIQKLENAWEEFSMGIMNSDLIKSGIDILTNLLQLINKTTQGIGEANWGNMISKIGLIVGAFKIGKTLLEKIQPVLKEWFTQLGQTLGEAMASKIIEAANGAKEEVKGEASSQTGAIPSNKEPSQGESSSGRPDKGSDKNVKKEKEKEKAIKGTNKELKKQGSLVEKVEEKWSDFWGEDGGKEKFSQLADGAVDAGVAITGVGVAITAIGQAFEKLGYSEIGQGIQEVGSGITFVGSALTSVGGIMQVLIPLAETLGIACWKLALIVAAIAVVVGLLKGAWDAIYKSSPAGKLEALKESAQEASKAADEASEAYNNLNDGLSALKDKYEALDNMTRGTEEWNNAVLDINESVLALMDKYDELKQYGVTVENGVLSLNISDEELQRVVKNYQKDVYAKSAASQQANFEVDQQGKGNPQTAERQQYEQYKQKYIDDETKKISNITDKNKGVAAATEKLMSMGLEGALGSEYLSYDEESGLIVVDFSHPYYSQVANQVHSLNYNNNLTEEEKQQLLAAIQAAADSALYVNDDYGSTALNTLLTGGLSASTASQKNKNIVANILDTNDLAWLYESNSEDEVATINEIESLTNSAGQFVGRLKKATNSDYYSPEIWDGIIENGGLGLTSDQLSEFQEIIQNSDALRNYFYAMPEEWRTKVFHGSEVDFSKWIKERVNNAEFAFSSSRSTLGGNLAGATATAQTGVANLLKATKTTNFASQIRKGGIELESPEEQREFYALLGSLYDSKNNVAMDRQNWVDAIETATNTFGESYGQLISDLLDESKINYDSAFLKDTMGLGQGFISAYEQANDKAKWNETLDSWYKDYKIVNSSTNKAYSELVSLAVEGLTSELEKQTEELENLADDFAEINENLLNGIRSIIEENRQARENEDTEENLNNLRNELAYASQDTSGSRAIDVLNLEKELRDAEQDYQDSLIDQALDKLEDANEKAEEQRQQQIDLLSEIADTTHFIDEAKNLVDEAVEVLGNGGDIKNTALGKLLGDQENFYTEYDESVFWTKLSEQVASAIKGPESIKEEEESEPNVVRLGGGGSKVISATFYGADTTHFATGGLADFTGPAWLDGTRAKPELVLNARDTQNFIALKDILSKAFDGSATTSQPSGDNHFDIDINVEKLESDYDVDQVADKIRRLLYDDASYRNVNAVGIVR